MKYIIGIDLGTTNSCVSYVDLEDPRAVIQSFKIPQLVVEGSIEYLQTLPSACYLAAPYEFLKGSLDLPWNNHPDFFVGKLALMQGAKVPTRLVQSAKSWLCHNAANRRDRILPLEAGKDESRISPVEATARYLKHIREAWNYSMARGNVDKEFEGQEIILTVPASFDEVARSLTVEAARLAGFDKINLLEEPQSAFYSWIAQHENDWQEHIPAGSMVLVCDVGGGTTDFSLIEVVAKEGALAFQRMAVGDHLLLGGDNMDASIAHHLETVLDERRQVLSTIQRLRLRHEARSAKEALLQETKSVSEQEPYRIVLQGSGSSVVQGAMSITLQAEAVRTSLINGFFGHYSWKEALQLKKTAGFRSMGLPYADEPSITKQLAYFLSSNAGDDHHPKKPDFVLFNGGAMKPPLFQEAVLKNLTEWFPEKRVSVLPSYNLDLAVARGAAYYGKVRRGMGVRIGGGMARGYYLLLDMKDQQGVVVKKALTLLPRGSEEGATFEPETIFQLKPNTPVMFQLATSHIRLHDVAGDLIDVDPKEMHILPPIQTVLRFGKKQHSDATDDTIPVHIHIELTPIGTLKLGIRALQTEHFWALEFQLKSASGQDNSLNSQSAGIADETFSSGHLKEGEEIIRSTFSQLSGGVKPGRIMEKLEEALKIPRRDWPPSLMRGLADVLLKLAPQRKLSEEICARWWNLIGFLMRPGFGYPLDDFRMKELWKVILSDLKSSTSREVSIQMWICYRRISGGLSKGQQLQLAGELMNVLLPKKASKIEIKSKADTYPFSEIIRAIASFELIESNIKIRLGKALIFRIVSGAGEAADFWALGRLGARHLLYGSLFNVLSREFCEEWIKDLLDSRLLADERLAFLYGQLAMKTEHREVNISKELVDHIIHQFSGTPYLERLQELLLKENRLTQQERDQVFGDHLPAGLMIDMQFR